MYTLVDEAANLNEKNIVTRACAATSEKREKTPLVIAHLLRHIFITLTTDLCSRRATGKGRLQQTRPPRTQREIFPA